MSEASWRLTAKGTLSYEDGSRTAVSLDRAEEKGAATEILHDLIRVLDDQTTWEIAACTIELRCYQDERNGAAAS